MSFDIKLSTNNTFLKVKRDAELQWNTIYWTCVVVIIMIFIHTALFKQYSPEQLIFLAKSFIHGNVFVDKMPLYYLDFVNLNGHIYLPFGPFSAIVLIPFLPLIKLGIQPAWISLFFTLVNVFLLNKILIKLQILQINRKWLLLFFFGGTVYLSIASIAISWFFAHIITTTCTLCAILGTINKKRPIIIGVIIGLGATTRLPSLLSLPFFFLFYWHQYLLPQDQIYIKSKLKTVCSLLIGVSIPLLFLLVYNQYRFGNPLETGYGISILGSTELETARKYGLFSPIHIPRNLYIFFFQGPLPYPDLNSPIYKFPFFQPSQLGMGFLFTSPAFIFSLKRTDNSFIKYLWTAIIPIFVLLMNYSATGWVQFGYRYSLDFLPYLIIVLSYHLSKPVNFIERLLIIISVIINLWGTSWLHRWM